MESRFIWETRRGWRMRRARLHAKNDQTSRSAYCHFIFLFPLRFRHSSFSRCLPRISPIALFSLLSHLVPIFRHSSPNHDRNTTGSLILLINNFALRSIRVLSDLWSYVRSARLPWWNACSMNDCLLCSRGCYIRRRSGTSASRSPFASRLKRQDLKLSAGFGFFSNDLQYCNSASRSVNQSDSDYNLLDGCFFIDISAKEIINKYFKSRVQRVTSTWSTCSVLFSNTFQKVMGKLLCMSACDIIRCLRCIKTKTVNIFHGI